MRFLKIYEELLVFKCIERKIYGYVNITESFFIGRFINF